MHPWHEVYIDEDQLYDTFPVVIEIPMGSKNKYELDKETGMLKLDRVLYSAVHYPANYGFIPAPTATTATRSTCSCSARSRWSRSASCARAPSA